MSTGSVAIPATLPGINRDSGRVTPEARLPRLEPHTSAAFRFHEASRSNSQKIGVLASVAIHLTIIVFCALAQFTVPTAKKDGAPKKPIRLFAPALIETSSRSVPIHNPFLAENSGTQQQSVPSLAMSKPVGSHAVTSDLPPPLITAKSELLPASIGDGLLGATRKPSLMPMQAGFPGIPESSARSDQDTELAVSLGSFSAGRESSGDQNRSSSGAVQVGGFPGMRAAGLQGYPPSSVIPVEPLFEGAEITEMPKLEYTELARNRKIEGIVRVSVVFKATGQVVVTGIQHSLGHGLDEAATAAIRRIRFKPARQDGREVDQPAIVEAVFRLESQTLVSDTIK